MALTVATAIFGDRYTLHEPAATWGHRFVCFTDQDFDAQAWEIVMVDAGVLSGRRANRRHKLLLHRFVDGPTLYLDAEFRLLDDPEPHIAPALEASCWAATRHPIRECVYREASHCLRRRVVDPDVVDAQVARYRAAGMPEGWGLWANGVLARRGDQDSDRLGEACWQELCAGSQRDQIALPFVAWRLGLPPATLDGDYRCLPWLARRAA